METKQFYKDKNDTPLTCVREVGFINSMGVIHDQEGSHTISTEEVFFIDPMGNRSFNATREAIEDGIAYLNNQVEVLKDYLLNDCNNKTHEWKQTCRAEKA